MYRDEYARAGIPLLPVIQPDGRSTGRQAVLYAAGLVPITLMPTLIGLASPYYLAGAVVLGAILMVLSVEFAVTRTTRCRTPSVLRVDPVPADSVGAPRLGPRYEVTGSSQLQVQRSKRTASGPQDPRPQDAQDLKTRMTVQDLPALNATLNALATVLLTRAGSSSSSGGATPTGRAC